MGRGIPQPTPNVAFEFILRWEAHKGVAVLAVVEEGDDAGAALAHRAQQLLHPLPLRLLPLAHRILNPSFDKSVYFSVTV